MGQRLEPIIVQFKLAPNVPASVLSHLHGQISALYNMDEKEVCSVLTSACAEIRKNNII